MTKKAAKLRKLELPHLGRTTLRSCLAFAQGKPYAVPTEHCSSNFLANKNTALTECTNESALSSQARLQQSKRLPTWLQDYFNCSELEQSLLASTTDQIHC